jgi:xanthine dehydrogenase molybdopterin-binding subunit B
VLLSSVVFALRSAIALARKEHGLSEWVQLDSPATVEKVVIATGLSYSMLSFD